MPAALTVDPMTAADLSQIMEIERLVFPQPWTPGLFLHELKIPFSRSRVVRAANGDRALLGYVCWWVVGDEVHILNLAVHPERQRGGVGRRLVHLVLDDAVQQRAASVSLEVRRDNSAAFELYRSLGFTQSGLRRNYYGRGEDAIIMIRHLAPPAAS